MDNDHPKPRKIPRQARSHETVNVIVEAAARILEREGHGAFSTNAVARLAGVSVGSLYQYFPSKDALVGALLIRETSLLLQEAHAAIHLPDGQSALSALIAACIGHQFRRPSLARLLDFEEARLPLEPSTQAVGRKVIDVAFQLLVRPDAPQQPDTLLAARDIIAIMKGMIDAAGMSGEDDCEVLAKRVQRAVFGYLSASDSLPGPPQEV